MIQPWFNHDSTMKLRISHFTINEISASHIVILGTLSSSVSSNFFFGHPTEIYSSQVSGKPQGLECFLSEDGWFAPWIPQNRQYSYIMENVWTCYVDCWPIKIEVFSTCSDTPLEKQKQHSNIQASGIASAKQSTELAPGCQHFSHVFHGWNR